MQYTPTRRNGMTKKLTLVFAGMALAVALTAGCAKKAAQPGAPAAGKAPAAAAAPANVSTYKAPDGSFTIALPEKFKNVQVASQPVQGAAGSASMTTYTAGSEQDHIMFVVSAMPVPNMQAANISKALEGSLKGLVGTGAVIKQANVMIDGNQGITARVKKTSGASNLFMEWAETFINNTMFQITVMTDDESKLDSPDVQDFIKSFKYTGAK